MGAIYPSRNAEGCRRCIEMATMVERREDSSEPEGELAVALRGVETELAHTQMDEVWRLIRRTVEKARLEPRE